MTISWKEKEATDLSKVMEDIIFIKSIVNWTPLFLLFLIILWAGFHTQTSNDSVELLACKESRMRINHIEIPSADASLLHLLPLQLK